MGKNRRGLFGGRKNRSKDVSADEAASAKSKQARKESSNEDDSKENNINSGNNKNSNKTPKVDKKSKAKQKSENNRSLRKIKKRDVVRQMLQRFPKESASSRNSAGAGNAGVGGASAFSASYDVSQAMQQGLEDSEANLVQVQRIIQGNEVIGVSSDVNANNGYEVPNDARDPSASETEEEGNYASRKLMIRQMQGIIARGVQGDDNSEYDSWTDLEENFAREYEPIPLHIHMDTWRKMTKNDIIKTIRSKKMRKDFEYMSRSEILGKIEKMQKSAKYLSTKFGVDHLLPQLDHVVAQVHREEAIGFSESDPENNNLHDDLESVLSNFSNNIPVYLSRSEILKSYETADEVRKEIKRLGPGNLKKPRAAPPAQEPNYMAMKESENGVRQHDSWSSRASSILNNPDSIYVSREEVLKNLHHPPLPAKGSKRPGLTEGKFTPPMESSHELPKGRSGKAKAKHDSWSSHASSILAKHAAAANGHSGGRDPNYVSRAELLEKLADLAYDTLSRTNGGNEKNHYYQHHDQEGDSSESMEDINDGTESDASTVKNVVLKSQRQKGANGLHHSNNISPVARSGSGGSRSGSGNKNHIPNSNVNYKHGSKQRHPSPPQQAPPLQQKRFSHEGQNHHKSENRNHQRASSNDLRNVNGGMNGHHHNQPPIQLPPKQRMGSNGHKSSSRAEIVEQAMRNGGRDVIDSEHEHSCDSHHDYYGHNGGVESDCDTCSCTSCESYTDCSCCGDDDEHIYSYTSSNSSVATVVEGGTESGGGANHVIGEQEADIQLVISAGRDKGKHKDIYIVNGSEVSSKQSKRSGSSSNHSKMRISKMTAASASANYDPIPKAKVKQMQLMEVRSDMSDLSNKSKGSSTSSKHSGSKKAEQPHQQMSSKEKVRKWDTDSHNPVPYAVNAAPGPSSKAQSNGGSGDGAEERQKEFEKIYAPVNAKEIQRQKNERVLRKHLRDIATDWDSRINDLNTLRRSRVLKELKKYLRDAIDLDNSQPEDINRQVGALLRQALDSNFEALSNLNIGHMYVPMEDPSTSGSKLVSRENTDYDTFGSIDSLIFEPKIPTHEDIKEAQEEIEQQFQYLNNEDGGEDSQDDLISNKPKKKFFAGPGKTTFAERVRLFQNLGKKSKSKEDPVTQRPSKKITFLDISGQETSWKELAARSREEEEQKRLSEEESVGSGSKRDGMRDSNAKRAKKKARKAEIMAAAAAEQAAIEAEQLQQHEQQSHKQHPDMIKEETEEDLVSNTYCQYCNGTNFEASINTACSICDTCTQCGLDEGDSKYEGSNRGSHSHEQHQHQQQQAPPQPLEPVVAVVEQQVVEGDASYNFSSATTSWNYLDSDKPEGEMKGEAAQENGEAGMDELIDDDEDDDTSSSLSCDSVINNHMDNPQDGKPMINLRRQLKEAFGSSPDHAASTEEMRMTSFAVSSRRNPANPADDSVVYDVPISPSKLMEAGFGEVEPEVELKGHDDQQPPLFLAEYAGRRNLTEEPLEPAVLIREGETVHLTEQMFRGDLKGTLKKIVDSSPPTQGAMPPGAPHAEELANQKKKQQGGSEMGDSGIASPPAAPSLGPLGTVPMIEENVTDEENNEDHNEDSGMEENPSPPPNPKLAALRMSGIGVPMIPGMVPVFPGLPGAEKKGPGGMKKRDTMIRELKSKLKEKFNVESASSSENNSLSVDPDQLPVGSVESRRETMAPKLSKLFGNKLLKQRQAALALGLGAASPLAPPPPAPPAGGVAVMQAIVPQVQTAPAIPPKPLVMEDPTDPQPPPNQPPPTPAPSTTSTQDPAKVTTFKSIYENKTNSEVSPKSCDHSEYESSVYDPSLPEELKKSVPPGIMFRGNRPFTPPVKPGTPVPLGKNLPQSIMKAKKDLNKKNNRNTSQTKVPNTTCNECGENYCSKEVKGGEEIHTQHLVNANPADRREFLYGPGGIFGPKGPFSTPIVRYPHGLEVPTPPNKRNVQFDPSTANGTRKLAPGQPGSAATTLANGNTISLSDCSSAGAEDRSVKSHYVVNSVLNAGGPGVPPVVGASAPSVVSAAPKPLTSRMETYRAEWADQECVASKPSKPLLPEDIERWREEKAKRMLAWINGSQLTGYWGSETPWWKVRADLQQLIIMKNPSISFKVIYDHVYHTFSKTFLKHLRLLCLSFL